MVKKICNGIISRENGISNILVIGIIILFCMPMILLRENYVFTIFDNLDSYAGFVEVVRKNHIYFKLNENVPVMGGLPSVYMYFTFNIYHLLNLVFGSLYGLIINRLLSVVLGYICMLSLLRFIFSKAQKNDSILKLLAIAYVVTPTTPIREISFAVLPLIVLVFLYFTTQFKFEKKMLLMIVCPFFTIFDSIGIFICGLWLLFMVTLGVIQRKININLIVGFLGLIIGSVITNPHIFITMAQKDTLNRSLIAHSNNIVHPGAFWKVFFNAFVNGQGHAPSLHKIIIMPICVFGFAYLFYNYKRYKEVRDKICMNICCYCLITLLAFSILYATNDLGVFDGFVNKFIPYLSGFNYGRIIHLSRLVWYIFFATILEACFLSTPIKKICSYVIVLSQVLFLAITPGLYSDVAANTKMLVKTVLPGYRDNSISFKEFFDQKLFDEIKDSIDYTGENVIAFGFHPSVLMYNGFNTLDGYASVHPMKNQQEFRKIIAPELKYCPEEQRYFDNWGGRMYVFCKELPYEPTIDKNASPVNMRIDINGLTRMEGRYILSRAEIINATELELELKGVYTHKYSIYTMYIYENVNLKKQLQ